MYSIYMYVYYVCVYGEERLCLRSYAIWVSRDGGIDFFVGLVSGYLMGLQCFSPTME